MEWPYRFVDLTLTADEKHLRRWYLDQYATVAQLSVLVPLLAVQMYHLGCWIDQKRQAKASLEAPSSPQRKSQRSHRDGFTRRVRFVLRRFRWWAGDPCSVFGVELPTKGEVLGTVAWTIWLTILCFLQTGEDYLHLTKRFGIVAASQLPFHYLLALKTPYSPLHIITRSSHETLNNLHQLLGRIVTLLLYVHAALYIGFYVRHSLLAKKLLEPYVIAGIVGIIAFTVVGTTALASVRRWSYKVFYIVHVSLATALLPVLYFHVSHIRMYLYQTAIIYALNALLRASSSTTYSGTIELLPETQLVKIEVPLPRSATKGHSPLIWQAGQHAYISLPGHPLSRTFRSNPFTVASLPAVDGSIRFVAKVLDGNTAQLARAAESATKATHDLTLEGPYGVATHPERLLRYDRILLIAGGVGATFTVPLYRQLLADLSPSSGSYRRQKVSLVWIARSKADVMWAVPENGREKESFTERLKVCLTGATHGLTMSANDGFAVGGDEEDDELADKAGFGDMEEGIELEEQKQLLHDEPQSRAGKDVAGLATYAGRPDLGMLVDQTFSHGHAEKVAVVVCGPRSLTRELRSHVGRWVNKGRDVWFWQESFAL